MDDGLGRDSLSAGAAEGRGHLAGVSRAITVVSRRAVHVRRGNGDAEGDVCARPRLWVRVGADFEAPQPAYHGRCVCCQARLFAVACFPRPRRQDPYARFSEALRYRQVRLTITFEPESEICVKTTVPYKSSHNKIDLCKMEHVGQSNNLIWKNNTLCCTQIELISPSLSEFNLVEGKRYNKCR